MAEFKTDQPGRARRVEGVPELSEERPAAALAGRFPDRRGELPQEAALRRDGGHPARPAAGDRLRRTCAAIRRSSSAWPRRSIRSARRSRSWRELENDHPSGDKLLPSFRDVLGGLRDFIETHNIVTIPSKVPPIVEETPPFMRALTTASMDTPGPYEKVAKEAFFNVTLPEKTLGREADRGVPGGLQPRHDHRARRSTKFIPATTCSSCGSRARLPRCGS